MSEPKAYCELVEERPVLYYQLPKQGYWKHKFLSPEQAALWGAKLVDAVMRCRLADKKFSKENTYHIPVGVLFSLDNQHLLLTFDECKHLAAQLMAFGLQAMAADCLPERIELTTAMGAYGTDGGDVFSGYPRVRIAN